MNSKTFRMAALFAACILLLLSPVGAASIDFNPSSVTVQRATTAEISLVLDSAPSGLAGYDLVIRLSNPAIAEIANVSYPSWASLFNTTENADGSVRISAVDLSRRIESGSTGITLGSITLQGLSSGSSSILMESVNMDADGGGVISPVVSTGLISVPGTVTGPSGGGGGGGGDSNPPVTRTPSPTMTQSSTATSPGTPSTQTPVITQTTAIPATVLTIETAIPTTAVTSTGEDMAIPWMWIGLGVIVLGIMILVAFLAWQKEQRNT
jgi:hypothetical protein